MSDRYIRQTGIFDNRELRCLVIGAGSIGRMVCMQLASIGIKSVTVVDFDTVGIENLSCQGFTENDLERLKVEAVQDSMLSINSEIEVGIFDTRYQNTISGFDVYFSCVDSMEGRKEILAGAVQDEQCEFFVDTRMSAEVFEIYTVYPKEIDSVRIYKSTLFTDAEAHQEQCTRKSTIYCANIASGFAVSELSKFVRGVRLSQSYFVDIYGASLIKTEIDSPQGPQEPTDSPQGPQTAHRAHRSPRSPRRARRLPRRAHRSPQRANKSPQG